MGGGGGIIHKTVEKVKKIGRKIKELIFSKSDSSSGNISQEEAYDMESAELQQTLRISKSLEEFRSSVSEGSEGLERDIVNVCWEQIDELMKFLRLINEKEYCGTKLKLNLVAMERDNREMIDSIYGSIRKDVLAKVNVDNPDCERILLMDPGTEKKAAMKKFMDDSVKISVNNLTRKLKRSLNKSCDSIEERIEIRLSDINDNVEAKVKAFEDFSTIAQGDRQKLEEKRIAVSKQMAEYSVWLDLIDRPVI